MFASIWLRACRVSQGHEQRLRSSTRHITVLARSAKGPPRGRVCRRDDGDLFIVRARCGAPRVRPISRAAREGEITLAERQIVLRTGRIRELRRALSTASRAERNALLAAAAFYGVLAGVTLASGDLPALAWAAALSLGLMMLAARLASDSRRLALVSLVALAGGIHMTAAVAIYSLAPHGFITGDDASYYRLASHAARYVRGDLLDPSYAPPFWGGDAYLFGGFVYLETALFIIFGPDVRIPLLLNSATAVVAALLIYASAVRLFDSRVALIAAAVVALYPSLILWSSLNLKDSLTTAVAMSAVWALVAFATQPRVLFMLAPFAAAEALVYLRGYVAATIAIGAALTIAVAALPWSRRVTSAAIGFVLATAIVFQSLAAIRVGEGNQLLTTFEQVRAAMAVGANTAFVPTLTPKPSASGPPATAGPSATVPPSATTVAPSVATVAPSAAVVSDTAAPAASDAESPPTMTLSYLPVGLAYAIFAPVPLLTRRVQELIAAPEMVWWYVLCLGALVTVWRERRGWRALTPVVLTTGGILLVLALTEGNVGTLFRHRGMVVPLVALLAAPALAQIAGRFTTRKAGP